MLSQEVYSVPDQSLVLPTPAAVQAGFDRNLLSNPLHSPQVASIRDNRRGKGTVRTKSATTIGEDAVTAGEVVLGSVVLAVAVEIPQVLKAAGLAVLDVAVSVQ